MGLSTQMRILTMYHLPAILLLLGTGAFMLGPVADPSPVAGQPEASHQSAGWPQFRGPDGQGQVQGPMPTTWSENDNNKWSVPIPGKGWSSPVILDGKVWLTTAVPMAAAKPLGDQSLRAMAVDTESGKILHDIELFTVINPNPKKMRANNTYATPTPILEKGRLYAHFGCFGNACVDTSTGAILWKNESLVVDYDTGPASSPLLYKDRFICVYDGMDFQFVAALSTATGEVLWKTERAEGKKKARPMSDETRAFSTPLLISVGGQDQVVIPGAFCVYSYDPMTGKEIWRAKYGGFSNVPRPVFAHGLVIVHSGFTPPEFLAIRPDGQGDVTNSHVVWRHKKNAPNVPSPAVVGEHLFMVSDGGIATCVEVKTGKMLWTQRIGGKFGASLLAHGNTLYAFDDSGKTTLFAAADTYKELGRNELKANNVQATPAVDSGYLYMRTDQRLIKLGP
jgi:outer membrane protein assembly factor BamB